MSAKKIVLSLGFAVSLAVFMPLMGIAQGQGQGRGHGNNPGQGNGQENAANHPNNQGEEHGKNASARHRRNILFILQDKVIKFDFPSGLGVQVGTATGKINGVSITNFDFDINFGTGEFTFNNWAGITDPDGDQIIFNVIGAGKFVVVPLVAPGDPLPVLSTPGAPRGGPVSGTYEVKAASGKYSGKFTIGEKFPFRAVGYNPNPAAVTSPSDLALGAVYVEVYSNAAHKDDDEDGD
ncbi:MAG: hypothetical protein ACRD88_19320 [Terriglobia bacterium]